MDMRMRTGLISLAVLSFALVPSAVSAVTTAAFDHDLYFGLRNNADVSRLQQFLAGQGFFGSAATGNFFGLTKTALQKFQRTHGIKPTGYFGPMTRGAANKLLAGDQTVPKISLSLLLGRPAYELDEQLNGVLTLSNSASVSTTGSFTVQFIRKGNIEFSKDADNIPVPPGATAVPLKDFTPRINADPALVGDWILQITQKGTSPVVSTEAHFSVRMPGPVTITVDTSSASGSMRSLTGFLMGFADSDLLDQNLTAALKPQFWRLAGGAKSDVKKVQRFGPARVSYILSDPYSCATCPAPWNDWATYESDIRALVAANAAGGRPVMYWDILNEPEFFQIPGITTERILEMYKRAYTVIRATDPQVKISGPSTGSSQVPFMKMFLAYARDNNLYPDAISWHEFDGPEFIPEHVAYMKKLVQDYDIIAPSGTVPELHINEYAFASNHLIPGWSVGWLWYLNQNAPDLAWTSRSCWRLPIGTDGDDYDCLKWLDGLLTKSGQTAPLYWVHRAQAEMSGGTIISAESTSPRTVALATKDTAGGVTMLIGRYSCGKTGAWCASGIEHQTDDLPAPPVPVTVLINNVSFSTASKVVQAHVYRVPNKNLSSALLAPVDMGTTTLPVINGTISSTIPQYQDGDVYFMSIKP